MTLTDNGLMGMKFHMLVMLGILSAVLIFNAAAVTTTPIGGDMGTYRIHCNVEAAKVFFDGEFKGNITSGILDVPVYLTGTPYRSFSIEKEGYYPYSGQIHSIPVKGSVVNIYATMSAIPPVEYGTLHLLVTPVLSSVSVDDTPAGDVPVTGVLIVRNVTPGNHVIRVSKQGYVTSTQDVLVEKNEMKKVSITLAAAGSGPLSVNSTPSGAQVVLDGQPVGVTPLFLTEVGVGEHRIMLKREGYQDYVTNISTSDEGAFVEGILVPASAAGGSNIGISVFTLGGALIGAALLVGLKQWKR